MTLRGVVGPDAQSEALHDMLDLLDIDTLGLRYRGYYGKYYSRYYKVTKT